MNFQEIFNKYRESFRLIKIDDENVNRANKFVNEVILHKRRESHHKYDGRNMFTRFYTGVLGELALEKFLNISFINWDIGVSSEFNVADLVGLNLNLGIKTVEYGKFPIIHKKVIRPEIINVKISKNEIYLCGLASMDCLNNYQSDDLILSYSLRQKGTKTGFYGFEDLSQFNNIDDLTNIAK